MSSAMVLYLDNHLYNVNIGFPSIKRKFEILEGGNSGSSILGKKIRDILGTNLTFTMTVRANPDYPTDYDSFFEQIRNPVESHTLRVPYGQSELSLTCYITDGEDTFEGYYAGYKRWDELTLTVKTLSPLTAITPVTPGFDIWTIGGSY